MPPITYKDCYYTFVKRLTQDCEHVAPKLQLVIQEEHAIVGQRTSPGIGT